MQAVTGNLPLAAGLQAAILNSLLVQDRFRKVCRPFEVVVGTETVLARRVTGPEIERLIQLLARLPGLGPRSARRAALQLVKKKDQLLAPLTDAMRTVHERVRVCSVCGQRRHRRSLRRLHRSDARRLGDRRGGGCGRPLGTGAGRSRQCPLSRARWCVVTALRDRA